MSRGITAAIKYRFRDSLRAVRVYGAIVLGLAILTWLITLFDFHIYINGVHSNGAGGFQFGALIFVFVAGICTVREDLRLFLQNGMGRKTLFYTELFNAALLAVSGALISFVTDLIFFIPGWADPYDTGYSAFRENFASASYFQSYAILLAGLMLAVALGMFISMSFYRMNKAWTIITAVGVPLVVMNGIGSLGVLVVRKYSGIMKILKTILEMPMLCAAALLVIAVILLIFDWLLMRRAPVKVAGK
ncbi:MAG: hypothetical protein VB111_03245 [Clostridiaceae bacterium]|nr:hypothetical protein [Clostridiaceae bacterium]